MASKSRRQRRNHTEHASREMAAQRTHPSLRTRQAGSVAIGLLLGVIAVTLGIEIRSLLIGEAASQAEVAAIGAALIDGPAVRRLIHLRILHLGPDELLVGAKVESTLHCHWSRPPRRST